MYIIPISPIPSQSFKVVLADQDCEIALLTRGESMYCDLTVNGVVIQQGAIIQDCVSIVQAPTDGFVGTLAMIDTLGNEAPRWDGLGDRWQLTYWTEGEEGSPRNLVPEFDGPLAE